MPRVDYESYYANQEHVWFLYNKVFNKESKEKNTDSVLPLQYFVYFSRELGISFGDYAFYLDDPEYGVFSYMLYLNIREFLKSNKVPKEIFLKEEANNKLLLIRDLLSNPYPMELSDFDWIKLIGSTYYVLNIESDSVFYRYMDNDIVNKIIYIRDEKVLKSAIDKIILLKGRVLERDFGKNITELKTKQYTNNRRGKYER
jgi:hypothetical protein